MFSFSFIPGGRASAATARSFCKNYPGDAAIEWECRRMGKSETLERLFRERWQYIARFNRIDRRHARSGVYLRFPIRPDDLRDYTPLPRYFFGISLFVERPKSHLLISFGVFGIFNAMMGGSSGKKTRRQRITVRERRKILDIHIGEPQLSVREIATRGRMKPSTVYRILSLFREGKIDRDGFRYENPLCL